jgi:hypothetical protein
MMKLSEELHTESRAQGFLLSGATHTPPIKSAKHCPSERNNSIISVPHFLTLIFISLF